MSTAGEKDPLPIVNEVKRWTETEELINFLCTQGLGLKDNHFNILREQEINGISFLELNVDKLIRVGFKLGPAEVIAKLIKTIKSEDQAIKHKKSASDVYFDTMDKISCPSKWAKEWTKDSKQKDGILFRNHRPTNASDIPIQFYHQIFETFINFTWDCQLSDRERKLVLELASVMSGVFSDESQRADAFRCWLELFFDDEIEIQSAKSNESSRIGERKIYGIIYPKIGRYRVLLANLEVKLEPGMNGDCYIQNDAYYKEFVIKSRMQDSEFYNKTCLPAFLIDLDGPNLSISGAVCVPFIICDRLTDILPLDRITYNHAKADDIARVFLALKNSIHILKDYYSSVYESREAICTTSPWFPCINEINLEEGTVTIKYKKRHSIHRNLWIVEIQTENTQEMGLVKFTQTYSKEAHGTCFELGLAPKLWAVNNLQQGWKIIVMEYLEEYKPLHTFNSEIFSKTESVVKNATKSFHDSGYVHGDLRDENIMVKYKYGKIDIKFVDFDWAGREGEAMYPESLNPAINWHVDVGWHKLIKREHDHHLVDNIYIDMSDDKPSKKRRRLSEWMS